MIEKVDKNRMEKVFFFLSNFFSLQQSSEKNVKKSKNETYPSLTVFGESDDNNR